LRSAHFLNLLLISGLSKWRSSSTEWMMPAFLRTLVQLMFVRVERKKGGAAGWPEYGG
jgi:hypothetical protein